MGNSIETLDRLRAWLPVGSTVWTMTASVSRSGMTRQCRFFILLGGRITEVSYYLAEITGRRMGKKGVRFGGCGYSATHAGVSELAQDLHGDAAALVEARL